MRFLFPYLLLAQIQLSTFALVLPLPPSLTFTSSNSSISEYQASNVTAGSSYSDTSTPGISIIYKFNQLRLPSDEKWLTTVIDGAAASANWQVVFGNGEGKVGDVEKYGGSWWTEYVSFEMTPDPSLTWLQWSVALEKVRRYVLLTRPTVGFEFQVFLEGGTGSVADGVVTYVGPPLES